MTHTLGCKVNFADTQSVAEQLLAGEVTCSGDDRAACQGNGGMECTNRGTGAPVEIVGTCCVTAEGEKQSRKEVRRALRRVGPEGRVFVTGCAARLAPEVFEAMGENVEAVAGEPAEAAAAIAARLGMGWPAPAVGEAALEHDSGAVDDGGFRSPEGGGKVDRRTRRTRFFLKVQEGCAGMCSYCVVPLVRGRPRSLPAAALQAEAAARVSGGFLELVATGINVGAYRDGPVRLPGLLAALAATPGLLRLRLSSIEATDVTPELVDVLAGNEVIGRHLHLPLQSGDDGVLADMGRCYRRADFAAAVARIREALPGVNLTTDVIVGYPAEDEAAFERTLEFVEEMGFSKAHVFTYSQRPGTRAAAQGDPVPPPEKKRRSLRLRRLSDRLGHAFRERKLGQVSEVLWESPLPSGGLGGYSSDYTRFTVPDAVTAPVGRVLAEAVTGDGIKGRLVDGWQEEG